MILLGMLLLALIELLCQGCAGATEVGNFPMKNGGFHGECQGKWRFSWDNIENMGTSTVNEGFNGTFPFKTWRFSWESHR